VFAVLLRSGLQAVSIAWEERAAALAGRITDARSSWRGPVSSAPRHLLVPNWWRRNEQGSWSVVRGADDVERWLDAAFYDDSLVTSVAGLHADRATVDDHPVGLPTSSSTLPNLSVKMFQTARILDTDAVLEIGTGSGYACLVAGLRYPKADITSIDVDPYLVETARERLADLGAARTFAVCDALGPLPGVYDRIVATTSFRTVPPSWLTALPVGGRLVTTIAGTTLLFAADKGSDGTAFGRIDANWAGFMTARHNAAGYPAQPVWQEAFETEPERGKYPVIDLESAPARDLQAMFELAAPGVVHRYEQDGETRTAYMLHADGSWAVARGEGLALPMVCQGGPRRLWDILEAERTRGLTFGGFPVRGAGVWITADGALHLKNQGWSMNVVPTE
jgi:protein-L-isoaspartate O-methyltransferase